MLIQFLIGLLAGAAIAAVAWRAHALTRDGALAAAITGGLVFGGAGIPGAALLLAFFVSSSALSRAFAARKASINANYSKGSQRDGGQVLANGGLAALLALVYALWPGEGDVFLREWVWVAFVGAIASVNADTWATELGIFNPTRPRLITSGRPVEPGMSGGISQVGTAAALAGAGFIGVVALAVGGSPILAAAASFGGLAGSLIDSLLGATLQTIYHCPTCNKETERHPLHTCGSPTRKLRGLAWLDNDWVNALASLGGSAVGLGVWVILQGLF